MTKKLKTCIKSDWCKAYMSKNYDKGKFECIESKICNDFIESHENFNKQ